MRNIKNINIELMGHQSSASEHNFYLASILTSLKNPRGLRSIISNPNSIADNQVRDIAQAVRELKKLSKIKITLSWLEHVFKNGFNRLW